MAAVLSAVLQFMFFLSTSADGHVSCASHTQAFLPFVAETQQPFLRVLATTCDLWQHCLHCISKKEILKTKSLWLPLEYALCIAPAQETNLMDVNTKSLCALRTNPLIMCITPQETERIVKDASCTFGRICRLGLSYVC